MDSLVSAEWLAAHLDDPDLVVVDCRITMTEHGPASAHHDDTTAHVPGAVFADLVNDLSDTTQPIGFAVPTPAAFCEAMGRLGVDDDSQVVLYDDRMQLPGMTSSSIWAARVWWRLRWVGFDSTALLDGGFGAWRDGGHRIRPHTDRPPRRRGVHSLTPRMGGRPRQSDGDRPEARRLLDSIARALDAR